MANVKRLIWDEDAKRYLIALAVGHHSETLHIDMILDAILHHAPTVDAVEVVHGRWIVAKDGHFCNVKCSACGKDYACHTGMLQLHNFDYCPNCGAKMDGGTWDNEKEE